MIGALLGAFGGGSALAGAQLALGAVSTFAQLQAGAAAAGTAEQQAESMEIDGIANEAQALQNMSIRIDQYNDALANNEAIFGFTLGGGESTSIQALQAAERKTLVKDIDVLSSQMQLDRGQTKLAAMIEVQRGRNAQRASFFNAIGSGLKGYIAYKESV